MSNKAQVRSIERRLVTTPSRLEVRKSTKANSAGNISGYAALFGEKSLPLPFTEIIRKGAFDATLRDGQNKFLLYAHDDSRILASLQGDTLTLSSDDKGLRFSADVADTDDGRTVITLAERGDLRGMSFGFICDGEDKWSQEASGDITRELLSVTLFEISCVGTGAYPKSFFDARSAPAAIRAKLKRDAGSADMDVTDPDYDPRCDPDSPDYDADNCPNNDDRAFSPCADCRSALCSRCSANFRSVRTAVDLQGLPMRGGLCVRCVRSLCSDCADAFGDFIGNDDGDTDARSRRQRAAFLLRLAGSN